MTGNLRLKAIDVPHDKGAVTPMLAAKLFYDKLPLIKQIYPFVGDQRNFVDGQSPIHKYTPLFVKMIVGGCRGIPLKERIDRGLGRIFLESNGNDTVTKWRLQIPKDFLSEEILESKNVLFIVENGAKTIREGRNEFSTILDNKNDMRVCSNPPFVVFKTVKTGEIPELFRGVDKNLELSLYIGYFIKGYESFVNIPTIGWSFMHSRKEFIDRNMHLDPQLSIASGTLICSKQGEIVLKDKGQLVFS